MHAYIVDDVNIKDIDGFLKYTSRIPELIEKHDGRYIVKGSEPKDIRKSKDDPQYLVVIELPSVRCADNFIRERAKTDLVVLFNNSTQGRILTVEGCI